MSGSATGGTNTEWILDSGDDTEMVVDGVLTGVGDRTKGETYTYTLVFRDATREAGEPRVVDVFNDLLDRGTYAGAFELHDMLDGPPEYTPTWPTGEPSLLVSLRPESAYTAPITGLWGLIDSVDVDTAPITGVNGVAQSAVLDLSLTYLADIREYATRDELRLALENSGLF